MSFFDRDLALRAACLVVVGAGGGLALNAVRAAHVPLVGFEAPVACTAGEGHGRPVEVTTTEASSLCGRAGVVFIDARPAERFAEGHIAGALHVPCDTGSEGADFVLGTIHRADTLVVYGQSTDEARGVAESLARRGAGPDVRVLVGGIDAWQAEGLACASGPCAECTAARTPARSP